MTESLKKLAIVKAANIELSRIGINISDMGGFCIGIDHNGRIAAGDQSGWYASY